MDKNEESQEEKINAQLLKTNETEDEVYKLYRYRYVNLGLYCLATMIN